VPIAILCGCALVAIVLILGGSGIDETSARALGTAAVLAVASLMASACLLLVRRRPELALLGFLGILIVAIAFLSCISAIWDVAHDSSQARSLLGRPSAPHCAIRTAGCSN
jgi:hypothetical protein